MDDLTPVKGPPTPFEGRSAKVLAVVLVALLVAIIKPWGDGSATVAPPVVGSASASANDGPGRGGGESDPLRPVGELRSRDLRDLRTRASLGTLAGRLSRLVRLRLPHREHGCRDPEPGRPAAPPPGASGAPPQPSPTRVPPAPSGTAGAPTDGGPVWPATIRITDGNHLSLVGVNTPLGYRVTGIGIFRTTDGADEALDVITPASDWPSHFTSSPSPTRPGAKRSSAGRPVSTVSSSSSSPETSRGRS